MHGSAVRVRLVAPQEAGAGYSPPKADASFGKITISLGIQTKPRLIFLCVVSPRFRFAADFNFRALGHDLPGFPIASTLFIHFRHFVLPGELESRL